MKDRLIELLKEADDATEVHDCDYPTYEKTMQAFYTSIADYLLANGVIVPPCKVGDTVYVLREKNIEKAEVFSIKIESEDNHWYFILKCMVTEGYFKNFKRFVYGKTAYLTKEEAEARLEEVEG